MLSFIRNDAGKRWLDLPRRDPTREIYDEAHVDKPETQGRRESAKTRQARALAVAKLMPLVKAGCSFCTVAELAAAVGCSRESVHDWRRYYPEAAVLIQKLLAPSSD